MGSVFAGFRKTARSNMAERQAGTLESVIPGRHICKQIWQPLVGEMLTLKEEEGNNHDKIRCQSPQACYCPWPCSSEFLWVTSSGMEGPSLVKLPIKESYFQALVLFVLCTTSPVCLLRACT